MFWWVIKLLPHWPYDASPPQPPPNPFRPALFKLNHCTTDAASGVSSSARCRDPAGLIKTISDDESSHFLQHLQTLTGTDCGTGPEGWREKKLNGSTHSQELFIIGRWKQHTSVYNMPFILKERIVLLSFALLRDPSGGWKFCFEGVLTMRYFNNTDWLLVNHSEKDYFLILRRTNNCLKDSFLSPHPSALDENMNLLTQLTNITAVSDKALYFLANRCCTYICWGLFSAVD